MNGLLDIATVIRGDGRWSSGYEIDALACGRITYSVDYCTPGAPSAPEDTGTGFKAKPWAIVGSQKFNPRCAPADAEAALVDAMEGATEHEVAHNFWHGDVPDWAGVDEAYLYLMGEDVATVPAGANSKATLAAVLQTAYDNHPEIRPIIHLGLTAAMDLSEDVLNMLDFDYVVSAGYPTDGIAVTGPVVVHLGSVETLKSHDTNVNRFYIEATRLAAVEFDPCLAVRAATV